ncbi:aspartyl-phosphate phosphatase Spo0E family protein [Caldifermentibacillus hisashii]|jgi:hypothetical protein|uniref:aspartyl-phosphate phosphatase Spo0E family protein n=1 Tax=Caldifermentibacillus hisashii TaxID=996558 RepID=UPI0031B6B2A2
MALNFLTSKIENTRKKMYQSIKQNGINSKETISLSQELDLLILTFQKKYKVHNDVFMKIIDENSPNLNNI